MKFRKKPVVIDAVRVADVVHDSATNWKGLPDWLRDAYESGGIVFRPDGIQIATPEGVMVGTLEDWLIRGTKGELYPCKPEIFEDIYVGVIE